jgi:Spy/CpxP family protein refolding chaperone
MQDKQDAVESARFNQMMEVRGVLTAEQRKKATEKVAKHMERMERMEKHHSGMGMGKGKDKAAKE